jgi:hypothetical protein
MTTFTGRRKKVNANIENILSEPEISAVKQIKNIQIMDINNFILIIDNLTSENTIVERNKLEDNLNKHYNIIGKLTPKELHEQINNVLFFKELIFNLRRVLNSSEVNIDLRKPFFSLLNKFDDKLEKIIEKVIEYRKTKNLMDTINIENHIANIVFGIYQKVLIYASPNTDIPNENLKTILTNNIISIQELMNNTNSSDVIVRKEKDVVVTQLANPVKFFKYDNQSLLDENLSFSVHSIQDLYLLFTQLKVNISVLSNIKQGTVLKRGVLLTAQDKYSRTEFDLVKKKLTDIVDNASKSFMKVLLYDYMMLLNDTDDNRAVTDYFEAPLLKDKNNAKRALYVYDNVINFMIVLRETFNKNNIAAYRLFVTDLLNEVFVIHDKLPKKNLVAKHLNFIRYSNTLIDLEDKFDVLFIKEKQMFVDRINEIRKKEKILGDMSMLPDISIAQPIQALNDNLNEYINDSVDGSPSRPPLSITVENTTDNINKFFKNLKQETNYQKILVKALEATRVGHMDTLPLSFYENYSKDSYKKLFICYFTTFFQRYSDIYTSFPLSIRESTSSFFNKWLGGRNDRGKFLNEHVKFIETMIERGYMEFNSTKNVIDFKVQPSNPEIEKLMQPVIAAQQQLIKLNKRGPAPVITNKPVETTSTVCIHVKLQEQINKINEHIEQFPSLLQFKDELLVAEARYTECELKTREAIICKYCHIKLGNIISNAPEKFADVEEQIQTNQRMYLNTNVQEIIRNEQEEQNSGIIDNYVETVINLFNITKQQNVSELDDSLAISHQKIAEIKSFINSTLRNSDRNIYNFSLQLVNKGTRKINPSTLKSQVVHDILKYLVIMNIYHAINGKIPNNLCNNQSSTATKLQCLFSKIQSLNQYIPMSVFQLDTRLNYNRIIFNQTVKIQNNNSRTSFQEDTIAVSKTNINQERMVIIAQDFGLSSNILLPDLINTLNNIPENIVEQEDLITSITKTHIKNYKKLFDDAMANKQLFTSESTINLDKHLGLFVDFNRLNILNNRNHLEDSEELNEREMRLNVLPLNMNKDSEDWNFINLYQYLKYNSRPENLSINKKITQYNKAHSTIDLSSLTENDNFNKLATELRSLYSYRRSIIKNRIQVLKLLSLFTKINPYLDGKISINSFNSNSVYTVTVSSKVGSISFSENLTRVLAEFLGLSITNVRLFVLENMLNDKEFQHHIQTEMSPL